MIVKSARPFASVLREAGLTAIVVDAGALAFLTQAAVTAWSSSTVGQISVTWRALPPSVVMFVLGDTVSVGSTTK